MLFELPEASYDLRMDLGFQCDGEKLWHSLYHFPRMGIGTMFLDYGNAAVLGRTFAFYGFIDQPYIRWKNFSFWGRFDHGIAIHSKTYDPVHNPLNSAISSTLNIHASLGLRMEYQFVQRLSLRLGAYFVHQSNSRITVPNLGLNTTKVLGGLSYTFPPEKKPSNKITQEKIAAFSLPKWQFISKIGLGLKEEITYHGPKYPVYVVGIQVARNVKQKRRYLMGVEAAWDMSKEAFKKDQEITDPLYKFQTFRPALSLGHEYLFGRIGLLTQANIYLRNTFARSSFWNARLGSRIYLNSPFKKPHKTNAFLGIYIKSHVFVADNLEFAVGMQF